MTDYLTLPDAAERLRCNERTVRRYIHAGELKASLIGGKYLITPDDLAAFVKAKEAGYGKDTDAG